VWVVVSAKVKRGYQSTTLYQHASTLRLTGKVLGLTSFPNQAATAPAWTSSSRREAHTHYGARPMTFKHKLSSRLALLKDRVVLASLAVLVTAAIVACELPVRAVDPAVRLRTCWSPPKLLQRAKTRPPTSRLSRS